MVAHCLFEQSGTFKNEFKKLGYDAYDYDILNDYGQTDFQCDLFAEIENAYGGEKSIFDKITPDDVIFAFFPCTYFECQSQMWFSGNNYSQRDWDIKTKCEYSMKRMDKLNDFYTFLNKLVIICYDRKLRLIIENPYNQPHFLTMYWCIKPDIIDHDRTENGDYYKKPTQYWFINIKPKNNFLFESIDYVETKIIGKLKVKNGKSVKTQRSEIRPQYANRFIRQYIIDEI